MRLLVLGANGLLGSNVVAVARDRGWPVIGTYHSTAPEFDVRLTQLDITNRDRVDAVVAEAAPDWVVNCAALTDVDECEERPERAQKINATAPEDVASICSAADIGLLHVSTDYVFDGTVPDTYEEDAATNPVQEYGKSKLAGEQGVRNVHPDALVPRLSFVYGFHRSTGQLTGFPIWVRNRLAAAEETPLFTDQHVTPTRAGQAATTFLDLIEREASGRFHIASRSCVTPYEFGVHICRMMDADQGLLRAGSMSDVDRVAERPSRTCLGVSRVEETLGRSQPTLRADLDAIRPAFKTTD